MPSLMQTRISRPKLSTRERGGVPRSQTERLWMISGGLTAFILLLIGYFFFISPQRSNTSGVKANVVAAKEENRVLSARIAALREQNRNLSSYAAELARTELALPSTSGIPDFLRALQSLGNATQTQLTALSVAPPSIVQAQLATNSTPTSSPSASPSPSPSATGTTPGGVTNPGVAQLYALPISATVTGSSSALVKFLDQLQAVQPRAVLITQITEGTAQGSSGPVKNQMSMQLTMDAFVAPSNLSENASLSAAAASHS
jgi:Tfp pilus assembly protein PilO